MVKPLIIKNLDDVGAIRKPKCVLYVDIYNKDHIFEYLDYDVKDIVYVSTVSMTQEIAHKLMDIMCEIYGSKYNISPTMLFTNEDDYNKFVKYNDYDEDCYFSKAGFDYIREEYGFDIRYIEGTYKLILRCD